MSFGIAIWAFPGPVGKAFGVDMTRDPLASYLSRLMGARDVALAWELLVTEGDAQRKWLLTCMVCDAADTLAAIAAGRGLSKRTTAMQRVVQVKGNPAQVRGQLLRQLGTAIPLRLPV